MKFNWKLLYLFFLVPFYTKGFSEMSIQNGSGKQALVIRNGKIISLPNLDFSQCDYQAKTLTIQTKNTGDDHSKFTNFVLGSTKVIAGIIPIAAIIRHFKKAKKLPQGEDAIIQYATLAASFFATCSGLKNLYHGLKS